MKSSSHSASPKNSQGDPWKGGFWGKNGAIAKARKQLKETLRGRGRVSSADAHSQLSSAYYGAGGNAIAHFRKNKQQLWRVVVAWFCLRRALHHSDKVVSEIGNFMTADQLDVRQTILRKAGHYAEAWHCITEGLVKAPEGTHTLALLLIGRADIFARGKMPVRDPEAVNKAVTDLLQAVELAPRFEQGQAAQAARIYRGAADVAARLPMHGIENKKTAQMWMDMARKLAERAGASDQMLKAGM